MSQLKDASRMAGISAPKRKRSKVQLLLLDLQESYIYMTSKFFVNSTVELPRDTNRCILGQLTTSIKMKTIVLLQLLSAY